MSIQVGQAAPSFHLFDSDKNPVKLEDFRGENVVLLFFPQAFTGTCTAELCSTRDDIASYQNLNARVFGVSVDSVFTLKKFREDLNLNFPLLSDFNKVVSTAYDAIYHDWILDMKGVSKRSAFVIDKEGIVRYAEVLESAGDLPNFEAVKQTLSDLQ